MAVPLLGATRGHDAGNGGFTVRCDAHAVGGARLEVLDYHEIPKRYTAGSLTLDLGKTGDEWARVKFVLDRLHRLDPTRAERYQDKANHFLENVNWVDHVSLPNVADLGTFYIQDSCVAQPTIIQYHGPIPEQKLYTVDKTTYDQLDTV